MTASSSLLVEQCLEGLLGKVVISILVVTVNIISKTTACVGFVVRCWFGFGGFFACASSTSL